MHGVTDKQTKLVLIDMCAVWNLNYALHWTKPERSGFEGDISRC